MTADAENVLPPVASKNIGYHFIFKTLTNAQDFLAMHVSSQYSTFYYFDY